MQHQQQLDRLAPDHIIALTVYKNWTEKKTQFNKLKQELFWFEKKTLSYITVKLHYTMTWVLLLFRTERRLAAEQSSLSSWVQKEWNTWQAGWMHFVLGPSSVGCLKGIHGLLAPMAGALSSTATSLHHRKDDMNKYSVASRLWLWNHGNPAKYIYGLHKCKASTPTVHRKLEWATFFNDWCGHLLEWGWGGVGGL